MHKLKFEEVLKHCDYKKEFSLRIREGKPRKLVLAAKLPDSVTRDGQIIDISMDFAIPQDDEGLSERDWLKVIRWAIVSLEMHEVDEWLTYKGEQPYDPHTR